MNSLNNSVIICDANELQPKKIINHRKRKGKSTPCKVENGVDLINKLSNERLRTPLRTVYESPLDHSTHNTCNGSTTRSKSLSAKRFRNDADTDIHLPMKKQKIHNMNETIIIVSDDDSEQLIPSCGSEIILVDDPSKTIPQTKSKKATKKKKKSRQLSAATHTGLCKDDEDIAVVWMSTNDNEVTGVVNKTGNNPDPDRAIFFVDTTGDKSNYEKHCLFQNVNSISPTSITYQNQPSLTKTTQVKRKKKLKTELREIIVDGCNVAFGYSHQKVFSKMGLKLVLDYFRNRGHTVKIFLPQNQRKKGREYLENWYRQGYVIFTPSRNIGGKTIVPYDDRFIVDYATKCKGIIVTSDQYRDLWEEKSEWRETIEKRLIAPTFVGDYVMFPEDPLGRTGPNLDEFLRH